MKIIKKIKDWLTAKDISNALGARYVIKLFRLTLTLTFSIVIIVALIVTLINYFKETT